MLEVLPQIPKMQASYMLGKPLALPINLTISVSYRCNSRCKTCNVWQRPNDDFTIEEYDKTFASIGRVPTGLPLAAASPRCAKTCQRWSRPPIAIAVPASSIFPPTAFRIKSFPVALNESCRPRPTSDVIVNLSLDGIGEKHDIVRGVKGNFERAMRTYAGLKALKGRYKNFTLGVHTVISNFNVDEFEHIYAFVRDELKPDSFIRRSLKSALNWTPWAWASRLRSRNISPSSTACKRAFAKPSPAASRVSPRRSVTATMISSNDPVEKRQIIPCLAGVASAQIAPNGDVWTCCIRAESVGNLREHNYDFTLGLDYGESQRDAQSIKAGECYCPLANASYTNMLCHVPTATSVAVDVAKGTAATTFSGSRGKSTKLRTLPVIRATDEAKASNGNGHTSSNGHKTAAADEFEIEAKA